ncbi:hypothetical protein CJF30_00010807 [Rutstroemia sp. NJR-2017a BBW]|nr:hypothetical protein CJF30_00010807 [Rutstroemia sp. NJR-2017a BBW]
MVGPNLGSARNITSSKSRFRLWDQTPQQTLLRSCSQRWGC